MTRERDQEDEEDRAKECLQEERRKEENGDYSGKEERTHCLNENPDLVCSFHSCFALTSLFEKMLEDLQMLKQTQSESDK